MAKPQVCPTHNVVGQTKDGVTYYHKLGTDANGKAIWCRFAAQAEPEPPVQPSTPEPVRPLLLETTFKAAAIALDAAARMWHGNPQEADEMLNLARRIYHDYAFPAALGKVTHPLVASKPATDEIPEF